MRSRLCSLIIALLLTLATSIASADQRLFDFGAVYGAQWTFYIASQYSIISEHGSFENWRDHPFRPQFDKDSFDYNLLKHSMAGQYYYLFYRSRGTRS